MYIIDIYKKVLRVEIFHGIDSFEWDEANLNKNWERHGVTHFECEEIFFNEPRVVAPDKEHSRHEVRYYALGKTNQGRLLFAVFTLRGKKIRIISARDMNKEERRWYR